MSLDLDTHFHIAALKSGDHFALAAQSGAQVAGTNKEGLGTAERSDTTWEFSSNSWATDRTL